MFFDVGRHRDGMWRLFEYYEHVTWERDLYRIRLRRYKRWPGLVMVAVGLNLLFCTTAYFIYAVLVR